MKKFDILAAINYTYTLMFNYRELIVLKELFNCLLIFRFYLKPSSVYIGEVG